MVLLCSKSLPTHSIQRCTHSQLWRIRHQLQYKRKQLQKQNSTISLLAEQDITSCRARYQKAKDHKSSLSISSRRICLLQWLENQKMNKHEESYFLVSFRIKPTDIHWMSLTQFLFPFMLVQWELMFTHSWVSIAFSHSHPWTMLIHELVPSFDCALIRDTCGFLHHLR